MQKTLNILKAVALIATIAVSASVCLVLLQVSSAVKHADSALTGTSTQLNGLIGQTQKTVLEASKLINDSRATVSEVNRGALDERKYFEVQLPQILDRADGVLTNVQIATADLHPLLTETTARVSAIAPIETSAAALELQAAGLLKDTDAATTNPDIAEAIAHVDVATAQLAVASKAGADAMGSVKAMAADGQTEVHNFTHPKPLAQIADWTLKVVHALGGWF